MTPEYRLLPVDEAAMQLATEARVWFNEGLISAEISAGITNFCELAAKTTPPPSAERRCECGELQAVVAQVNHWRFCPHCGGRAPE